MKKIFIILFFIAAPLKAEQLKEVYNRATSRPDLITALSTTSIQAGPNVTVTTTSSGVIISASGGGSTLFPHYTITNSTVTRTFDASSYTLDQLANVIGTVASDLGAGGGQTYVATNVSTDRSLDASSYTSDELSNVVGTIIKDLQTAGIFL